MALTRAFLILLIVCSAHGEYALRMIKNSVFGPGEKFTYEVRYGFIHGGFAKLEILDTARIRGFLCHRICAVAHSNPGLSIFFPVRDTNISHLDVNGLFSLKITKRIHEGGYRSFRWIDFYPDKQTALYRNQTYPVAPFSQDVLSAFFYLRLLPLRDSVDIPCFDDKKNYMLRVLVLGKEKVKTKVGKFDCLILEPKLASPGIFLKSGRMKVWVTDDPERVPVKLAFKLPFLGHITCILEKRVRGRILCQAAPEVPAAAPAGTDTTAD